MACFNVQFPLNLSHGQWQDVSFRTFSHQFAREEENPAGLEGKD